MNNEEMIKLNYIKDNWQKMKPTIPIVIPSYKNRNGNIVQSLDKVSENDIYVFVYEEDYKNSGYDKYDNKPNVHFVKINATWRSLPKKRFFIQQYFLNRNDIKDYIMIDDDLFDGKLWTIDKTKYNHIPLINFLGILEYAHKSLGDKRTYSCGAASDPEFGHYDFKKYNKEHGHLVQVFAISNEFVQKSKVMFRDTELIAEDVVITHDLFKAGYSVSNFSWLKHNLRTCYRTLDKSNASSESIIYKFIINTMSLLREYTKPFTINDNNFGLNFTIRPYKYWNLVQPILDDKNKSEKEKYIELNDIFKNIDKDKKDKNHSLEEFLTN